MGRCGGRCEVLFGGRFDWNLPRERLFLSRNIGGVEISAAFTGICLRNVCSCHKISAASRRIVEGWRLAADDPYRAATHNKGIMNGVDALALGERDVASFVAAALTEIYLCASCSCHEISRSATAGSATGQDWRALEAAAHCYATTNGVAAAMNAALPPGDMAGGPEATQPPYGPLSTYRWVLAAEVSAGSAGPRSRAPTSAPSAAIGSQWVPIPRHGDPIASARGGAH
eukprot:COSAG01_NODE_1413_length_10398_cov_73.448296_7_plen_229_part_00